MPFRVAMTASWHGHAPDEDGQQDRRQGGEKGGVVPLGTPDAQHVQQNEQWDGGHQGGQAQVPQGVVILNPRSSAYPPLVNDLKKC